MYFIIIYNIIKKKPFSNGLSYEAQFDFDFGNGAIVIRISLSPTLTAENHLIFFFFFVCGPRYRIRKVRTIRSNSSENFRYSISV